MKRICKNKMNDDGLCDICTFGFYDNLANFPGFKSEPFTPKSSQNPLFGCERVEVIEEQEQIQGKLNFIFGEK